MSKQAVVMVVDVGNSMDEPFSDSSSRVKIALECCKITLQQKIFNNSTHEVGLILSGDNDSDDERPTIDFVRKVEQLSLATFGNTKSGGDILSSINYSLNMIKEHVGKKKYKKRMFVFTNGSGHSQFEPEDLNELADKLMSLDVKLNVVPIDFMVSYDQNDNKLDGEVMESVQENNAGLLMEFKRLAQDYVQIFPVALAIELYKKFRTKDTNPVARFKGFLELGPGLQIEVATYKAVRSYDASVQFDPVIPKEKEIITQTNYVIKGDESGDIVDKENIVNAYSYGPQLVPISPILEAGSKIFEDRNFRLLGFVDKSRVPRHAFMGEVDIVVPSTDNQVGRKLFTSFIFSMLSMNKYALARYVPRSNKNGIVPKMVILIPYRSADREMFYLVQLPTVEDVKQFPFKSLKQSTTEQKEMVRNLIDKMMLVNQNGEEEVKVENTFNPYRQYFYQSIFYRALNDKQDLPPLDPVIKNYITPENQKYQQTHELMAKMKKSFKLIKKVNLAEKNKKNALTWKQAVEELNSTNAEANMMIKQEENEEFVKSANKFTFEDEQQQNVFNPAVPIASFKKMINYNKEDLVAKALEAMTNYMSNKLTFSVTEEAYKHLSECASEMRSACVNQQEDKYWDRWFMEMRDSNTAFWNHMKSQGLGLIKGDNTEVFKPVELHQEDIDEALIDLD